MKLSSVHIILHTMSYSPCNLCLSVRLCIVYISNVACPYICVVFVCLVMCVVHILGARKQHFNKAFCKGCKRFQASWYPTSSRKTLKFWEAIETLQGLQCPQFKILDGYCRPSTLTHFAMVYWWLWTGDRNSHDKQGVSITYVTMFLSDFVNECSLLFLGTNMLLDGFLQDGERKLLTGHQECQLGVTAHSSPVPDISFFLRLFSQPACVPG